MRHKLTSDNDQEKPEFTKMGRRNRDFVSAGEQIHTWSTYLAVDWIYNTAVGVAFAYWGKYTKSGRKYWSEPVSNFFETVLKPFIKDEAHLKSSVKNGNLFASIIAGGMATIPPLLVLENNSVKRTITQFYDSIIYGKQKTETDPKFKKAYDEIEEQPTKDFLTGMTSRFAALAPLLAIVLIPFTKKISHDFYFSHIANASEKAANAVRVTEKTLFKNITEEELKIAGTQERWKYVHDAIAMDFGLGVWYAGLHGFFYNLFANRKEIKEIKKEEKLLQRQAESDDTLTNHRTSEILKPGTSVQHITHEQHLLNVAAVQSISTS